MQYINNKGETMETMSDKTMVPQTTEYQAKRDKAIKLKEESRLKAKAPPTVGARLANSQHRGNGWMDKVVDMREQLYAATGPTQFKRIKKDFSINEPDACERMLANPDIMYSIPQEFSPNVTNTAIPGGDKLVSNTKVKPVKQTHRQPDIGSSRLWDNNTKATHDSRK